MRELKNLGRLRDGWKEIAAFESSIREEMSVQESLAHYFSLREAFEPQLRETDGIFLAARQDHLSELQRKISLIGNKP